MDLDSATALALGGLDQTTRNRFAAAPTDAIIHDLGLTVTPVNHLTERRNDGGACDGVSFLQDGVILYAPTHSSKRENFTLAHELAHWLVERCDQLYDWLADQDEPARMLETLCDRIAQRLLLPDALIDTVTAANPVRAEQVLQLHSRSNASRPVCAIALARRLPCCGAVLIIDHQRADVVYASVRPDFEDGWPTAFPWPGHRVPAGHPFLAVVPGTTLTRRTFWETPWGTRQDYYADAVRDGRWIVAVLAVLDIWGAEQLHIDEQREFDQRPSSEITCCGATTVVWGYPCDECGQPFCPRCKRCNCDRRAAREQACSNCFLRFQRYLLVDGVCEECRN
ncbi:MULTISPECIES: ImmA/IrrE family metallo-endopeptidase [unclassified Mycobacterium]|uniref:ImmA/IrrE family metallo-endopeptidase n=1 Tax=unclassified Mycobacterium TaxID=2642494 RepID=UPI0029C8EEDD|nr:MULTISPECIES: ImmA/IrrE family metallo-endopeptidase [unclassified Mycobacterium]